MDCGKVMAVSSIIKNVYTFAKILCQAGTDIVHQWDTKSVENAFNWARYCEKVEEQTREKSFRNQLDQQLQSLTLLLTPVTLLDFRLDRLKHASTHLARVLASSRNYRETSSSGRALHSLLGYDPSAPDTSEGQASIVMKRLARLRTATASKQRYHVFFEEFLLQLSDLCQGWEILLYVLLTDIESEADHWDIEEIKGEILHWVIQHSDITSSLWKVDSDLLLAVCSRDHQFYQFYSKSIIQWAANMEPVYGLTEEGDLYKWCYEGKEVEENYSCEDSLVRQCLCYNCLVRHVHRFLSSDENIKLDFNKTIKDLSKKSHFNIWTEILKSVKERLK